MATKRGHVLLVRRRHDRLRMFPGGRRQGREREKDCLEREIKEELPKLRLGRLRLWKEVKSRIGVGDGKSTGGLCNEDCIAHLVERLIFGAGALPRPKIARKRR